MSKEQWNPFASIHHNTETSVPKCSFVQKHHHWSSTGVEQQNVVLIPLKKQSRLTKILWLDWNVTEVLGLTASSIITHPNQLPTSPNHDSIKALPINVQILTTTQDEYQWDVFNLENQPSMTWATHWRQQSSKNTSWKHVWSKTKAKFVYTRFKNLSTHCEYILTRKILQHHCNYKHMNMIIAM